MMGLKLKLVLMATALFTMGTAPVMAQIESIDPNTAYQADGEQWENAGSSWEEDSPYADPDASTTAAANPADNSSTAGDTNAADNSVYDTADGNYDYDNAPYSGSSGSYNAATPSDAGQAAAEQGWDDPYSPKGDRQTQPVGPVTEGYYEADPSTAGEVDEAGVYQKDDLIGAAEGLFGQGAEGLAGMIEKILAEQGKPNAYIVGREGGAALVFGLRYGSGTLFHKVEGERPVYWTGPSVGIDAGAQAANTFVLVYNLYDSEELFNRFVAGEGAAYLVGGFHASYLRKGNVVLIPVRMGVGARLGVNVGYMKFSHKQNWFPF